jgi:hypothetical protein
MAVAHLPTMLEPSMHHHTPKLPLDQSHEQQMPRGANTNGSNRFYCRDKVDSVDGGSFFSRRGVNGDAVAQDV